MDSVFFLTLNATLPKAVASIDILETNNPFTKEGATEYRLQYKTDVVESTRLPGSTYVLNVCTTATISPAGAVRWFLHLSTPNMTKTL